MINKMFIEKIFPIRSIKIFIVTPTNKVGLKSNQTLISDKSIINDLIKTFNV